MIIIQFRLCQECMHIKSCVLTNQKENVFSCSEFDEKLDAEFKKTKFPRISGSKVVSNTTSKVSALEFEMAE